MMFVFLELLQFDVMCRHSLVLTEADNITNMLCIADHAVLMSVFARACQQQSLVCPCRKAHEPHDGLPQISDTNATQTHPQCYKSRSTPLTMSAF